MQRQLVNVDCILEIHDARLPVSGRNPNFRYLRSKPTLVLLNKADLISLESQVRRPFAALPHELVSLDCAFKAVPREFSVHFLPRQKMDFN